MGFWVSLAVAAFFSLNFLVPRAPMLPQAQQQAQHQEKPTNYDGTSKLDVPSGSNDERQSRFSIKEQKQQSWDNFVADMERNSDAVVAISTIVIALFTVALFVTSYLLWHSGRRHSERELRAYVFPTVFGLGGFAVGATPEAHITIKNTGQTPAYRTTVVAGLLFGPHPSDGQTPPLPRPRFVPTTNLAPGSVIYAEHEPSSPLTAEQHAAVMAGDAALYVVGRIEYFDAFDKARFTNFFAKFTRANAMRADGALSVCHEGNDCN